MHAKILTAALAGFSLLFLSGTAHSHSTHDQKLSVQVSDSGAIQGEWMIPCAELQAEFASCDPFVLLNQNTAAEALHQSLNLSGSDQACAFHFQVPDGPSPAEEMGHLFFQGQCASQNLRFITIDWLPSPKADPGQQVLVRFDSGGTSQSSVLSRAASNLSFGITASSRLSHAWRYVRDGILHIWTGTDHLLFLITLMLPSAYVLVNRQWQIRKGFLETGMDILKTVSAFTLAHSLTLALATFHLIHLPSRWVESVIALTVLLTACNNLMPRISEGRWKLALVFGLIHGMGFAEVLRDLQLPTPILVLSLVAFNVGVEIGQLAVVVSLVPLIFIFRAHPMYRRFVFNGGSLATALVAMLWMMDRVFELGWMPF